MSEDRLNPQELDRQLSQIGARMAVCGEDNREEVLGLAREFSAWLETTAGLPSFPTGLLGAQARQVLRGLNANRPLDQVCQRLSQAMAEAVHHMGRILEQATHDLPLTRWPLAKGDKSSHQDTKNDVGLGEAKPQPYNSNQTSSSPPNPSTSSGSTQDTKETLDKGTFAMEAEDVTAFQDFVAEAPEHLQAIESGLLALVQGEAWDPLKVYRPFHTLKGICGFMGLPGLTKLAHQAETILERYKNGKGRPSEKEVDLLLEAGDVVKKQVDLISQGLPNRRFALVDVEPFLKRLSGGAGKAPATETQAAAVLSKDDSHSQADHFLRIAVEKMDMLLETVGELAICQSQVTEGIAASGVLGHLGSEASRLAKISRQLQEIVLSLRMVPVHPLFQRMSRLARDLSNKTGKPLRVELHGGETELDKRLTEELVDPLVHLLRNAVDHGLEAPEGRRAAGKPEEARLSLTASHQGGDFVLRIEDDGAGLPFEKLRQKGAVMGYLGQGETSPARLTELIFLPGFSTAEKVTEVSGRGVGLDAVKRKVLSLKGSIQVESEEGRGTAFIIRIPLTMALIDGIVVRVAGSRYILPSFHVRQFMAFREMESHQVSQSREWMTTPYGQLPVVELAEWFGCGAEKGTQSVVIHVAVGEKEACLVVDEVVGKQQVVVKGLGEHLQGLPGVAGGAILGDGQVGFILDLGALVQGGRAGVASAVRN